MIWGSSHVLDFFPGDGVEDLGVAHRRRGVEEEKVEGVYASGKKESKAKDQEDTI
jgi:hypothetical protein